MAPSAISFGALIASVGHSVAEAQQAIDGAVLDHFRAIYEDHTAAFEPLRAIAYQPTWYQVTEARAELAIAVSTVAASRSATAPLSRSRDVQAAPVDARYRSQFSYAHHTASRLKFRVVPVPPPEGVSPPVE